MKFFLQLKRSLSHAPCPEDSVYNLIDGIIYDFLPPHKGMNTFLLYETRIIQTQPEHRQTRTG